VNRPAHVEREGHRLHVVRDEARADDGRHQETKNRTNPFDAGTAKKVRSGGGPGGRAVRRTGRTIEVIVVKAAPITVTTIAAGRRNSRRSPVAMMARTFPAAEERELEPRVRREEIDIYAPLFSVRATSSKNSSSRLRISLPCIGLAPSAFGGVEDGQSRARLPGHMQSGGPRDRLEAASVSSRANAA